ncbi:uncharacterized protein LOC113888436 [Bos indicus x Bos taurus]|uniref:uncharacterized protein LOC113888436 n=1 Tax=Bos indicus x Bos taurus TaxID=30522 RepID=UPI000F7D11DC|nr:uncharacterized protein LOC113888436 [Bos indicus x Bos taurus]
MAQRTNWIQEAAPAAGVSQPGRGRGGTLTRQTRASRGSRPAAGWASPPGTPAASCQPGLARNQDTLLLETRPPHRSARRELENRLLPGEERRLPARWSAKPPLGRRLWATAKRQRCHGCWKPSRGVAAGGREGRAESAGSHREMRDQEPKQFMEAAQSDNGPAFLPQVTKGMTSALDIKWTSHSSWRPCLSRKVERSNQTLKGT